MKTKEILLCRSCGAKFATPAVTWEPCGREMSEVCPDCGSDSFNWWEDDND